jgi:hypothetical protein
MTLKEAYQKLSECFTEIKDAIKQENLTKNQVLVLEALSLARPTDVGVAGSIATLLAAGEVDGKLAHKILSSRFRPWSELKCDDSWGIPPTEEAAAEWKKRQAAEEDYQRLKRAVFPEPPYEHVTDGAVMDEICSRAGYVSYHSTHMYEGIAVPKGTVTMAETVAENLHEVLAPLVLSAGMQCGKVTISWFSSCQGVYYCSFSAPVGSTTIVFKKVRL